MTPAQLQAQIIAQINDLTPNGITGDILQANLLDLLALLVALSTGSRIVVDSVPLVLLDSDYRVGLNRTAALAAMNVQLVAPAAGTEIIIQDLAGNFSAFPVTVAPPGGQTFSGGRTSYVMNEDNQTARFNFYIGASIWGIEPA